MASILVVEDNLVLLEWIVDYLTRHIPEVSVRGAHSYASALDACKEERFSLIIADHRLPDGDGIRLMEALRVRDRGLKCILASGESLVGEMLSKLEGAIVAVLSKPYEPVDLVAKVRDALGMSEPAVGSSGGRLRRPSEPKVPVSRQSSTRHRMLNLLTMVVTDLRLLEAEVEAIEDVPAEVTEVIGEVVERLIGTTREISDLVRTQRGEDAG